MASTPHRQRLTRKDLREPDEFVSLVEAAGDYVAAHLPRVIAGAVILFVVILVAVGLKLYFTHRDRAAATAFYQAGELYDQKDYKNAAPSFAALAADYPGTKLGRLALLYLGDTYLAQNQAAQARDSLRKFLDTDERPTFRQLALLQLGAAYESLGNLADARGAYAQAAAIEEGAQGWAELQHARLTLQLGDKPGAIEIYQRFLREHPFDPQRGTVIDALGRLGVKTSAAYPGANLELPSR
jgi:tetratricopeptide (TPR) repeat protein